MKASIRFFFIFIITLLFFSCETPKNTEAEYYKKVVDSLQGQIDTLNSILLERYSEYQNTDFLRQLAKENEYIVNREVNGDETVCGRPDFKNIYEYNGELGPSRDFVLKNANPVGAICSSNEQSGLNKYCSGTLISEDLFLTASHCIDSRSTNDYVVFNYQLEDKDKLAKQDFYRIIEVVEKGYKSKIDYAIVKLEGSPGKKYGYTPISLDKLRKGEQLTIIQHPVGEPKQVEAGHLANISERWMTYNDIDTKSGSSGSGILNEKGKLVGVHTNGGCDAYSSSGENHGMNMVSIAKYSKIIQGIAK